MNKTFEMKIYEKLGIKTFKNIVLKFAEIIIIPFTHDMTKEERHKYIRRNQSNYFIGKVETIEDVKRFKKGLFYNASVHTFGLLFELSCILINFSMFHAFFFILNSYLVMLQRYNFIRVNKLIKKMKPVYKKKIEKIKEEIKEQSKSLNVQQYKMISKKGKETIVSIDQILENLDLKTLREYRTYLGNILSSQEIETTFENQEMNVNIDFQVEENKSLKLSLN